MADKNLHDIKIDELDSPKKTPLKNILTLLALLFIILVISVVITKLILNTDDEQEVENATDIPTLSADVNDATSNSTDDKNSTVNTSSTMATTAAAAAVAAVAAPTVANVLERNITSRTKVPLRTHEPVKEVKKDTTSIKTHTATPKKYKAPKHTYVKTPKKHTTTHTTTVHTKAPKKSYIDKVVTKKSTSTKSTTSTKKASYLGGHLKELTNSYYIKVGSYRDTSTVVKKIKKSNFNYTITKLKDDKTISRVLVGPFFSENEAQKNIAKVKSTILPGAYITKVKP